MRDGAVITRVGDNIMLLAFDSYNKLESQMDIFRELAGEKVLLVRTAGNNMEDIRNSQERINETFGNMI